MKKIILLFIILLLFTTSTTAMSFNSVTLNQISRHYQSKSWHPYSPIIDIMQNYQEHILKQTRKEHTLTSDFIFFPEDIELKDDAFHGADTLHFTEWWYFDAIFDNGYTAQVGIRVLGLVNQGLIYVRLDIYKEGELESHELKKFLIWDFYASEDFPLIILDGKQVMEGYIDETTGEWIYDVTLQLDRSSVDLHFVGCSKGWKGSTPGGKWAVILPRANVSGTLTTNTTNINVSGIGYHDHNWEITAFTGVNFGWFWGKVNSDHYTLTWAKIMTTRFWGQPLLVVNKGKIDFINILPEDIQLDINDIRLENGMLVPFQFNLNVQTGDIAINIIMDVIDTHHVRWVGVINYWRYHLRCRGSITIGSHTEQINEIQLAEFIRFR